MKIVFFDCSSGISGDMCLGALVDAGVPLKKIEQGLKALRIKGYELEARRVRRASIAATKVDVIVREPAGRGRKPNPATWKDIRNIIERSSLHPLLKQKGLRIFKRLFEAEGKVHGRAFARTHLHELGAVDCLVDVFGALIGLDLLGVEKICSSALNLGSGFVKTEHGRLPVPAPATAELLKDAPVYSTESPFELTTPTGAAILRETAQSFGPMPLMQIRNIGYGAGNTDTKGSPNVLRIFLGQEASQQQPGRLPTVTVIETNIDDMNPQWYELALERLFDAGALDVSLTQVIMKKGRPGILLTVLCHEEKRTDIIDVILRETTTIGLRFYEASRVVLDRKEREKMTGFGKMKVKMVTMRDGMVRISPEYEVCKKIARKYGMPLGEVVRRSRTEWEKP